MEPDGTDSLSAESQGAATAETPHEPFAVVPGKVHPPTSVPTVAGVDVSSYQGAVDWVRVRRAGYRFAACKATEGIAFLDPTFGPNWAGLKRAGMARFAYHFFHPGVDPEAAVDAFHAQVRQRGHFQPGDGILFDFEVTDGDNSSFDVLRAEQWIAYAVRTIARPVFLYTGAWFWTGVLHDPAQSSLSRLPLWIAAYGSAPTIPHEWPSGASFWQYSETGRVPGISAAVDLDRFYGSMAQLHTLLR